MKANDSLSVYIISFNHAKFIEQCVESVLSSENISFDVTVIDNGSTDGSQDKIIELSNKFDIKVILNEINEGLPATLNKMLASGNSKYVCFLAADDYIEKNRFSEQTKFLNENGQFYACAGSQIKVDENGHPLPKIKQRNIINRTVVINSDNIFSRTNIIYSPTAIFRREVLSEIGGYSEDIQIEDLYLFYKAASKGHSICLMPNVFTYYRVHGSNSHKKLKWMHENKLKILNEYEGSIYYNSLYKLVMLEGFYSLSASNKAEAITLLPRVIRFLDSKYLYAGLFKLLFWWR
ncbi:MAG: glycosyltransferase family 2 protein [Shewanella sp.]